MKIFLTLKKPPVAITVWAIICVLIVAFIFSNSFKTVEQSKKISNDISNTEVVEKVLPKNTFDMPWKYSYYIRKSAHVIEFSALGIAVSGLIISIKKKFAHYNIFMGLFFLLFVSFIDEYIQTFTDRGPLVTDIMIDFVSSVSLFTVVLLSFLAISAIKRKKLNKKIF